MAELNHIIEFEVGDWSKDGHNQSDTVQIKSNYSGKELDEAFARMKSETGIDFQNICEDYEDNEVHEDELQKFVDAGLLTTKDIEDNSDEDGYCFYNACDLANFALDTLVEFEKKHSREFAYECYSIPNLEQCNALQGIGYGCYY